MWKRDERPEGWGNLNEFQADRALPMLAELAGRLVDEGIDDSTIVNELSRKLRQLTACSQRRVAELECLAWWLRRKRHLDSRA